jgi:hypothetical protein
VISDIIIPLRQRHLSGTFGWANHAIGTLTKLNRLIANSRLKLLAVLCVDLAGLHLIFTFGSHHRMQSAMRDVLFQ